MARLPTIDDLGQRPTPQPTTSIAVARTGFEAEALSSMGEALSQIGTTLVKARRASQLTDALGRATEELETRAVEYQRDQDFKTSPTRFKGETKTIGEKYAKSIDDPLMVDMFQREFAKKALERQLTVVKGAAKQEQDYNISSLDSRQDIYVRQAVESEEGLSRDAILNEARGDLAVMRKAGWITDVEAGVRERVMLGKIDQAIVVRDMSADPITASQRLSLDAKYAPNLDPLARERLVDQGFRRAEAETARAEREQEKARRAKGDEIMLDAFDRMAKGRLTPDFVQSARAFVSPSEYHSLLKGLEGGERKDDPVAFAELVRLSYTDPKEAERLAMQYQRAGRIKNETLASTFARSRSIDRQEGPKTEYERSRQFIATTLKPNDFVPDPAAAPRFALAIREYDDYANGGKATDGELREKANDIVKRWTMANMTELARRTSAAVQNDPVEQLKSLAVRGARLQADFSANKITQQKFNQEMANLNTARKAAEQAARAQ